MPWGEMPVVAEVTPDSVGRTFFETVFDWTGMAELAKALGGGPLAVLTIIAILTAGILALVLLLRFVLQITRERWQYKIKLEKLRLKFRRQFPDGDKQ